MIIAGNFKANLTRGAVSGYLEELKTLINNNKCYIFPSASSLQNSKSNHIIIGAQNGYPAKSGAFTGETCLEQLQEFDIQTILIGHSERRHVIGESQEAIAKKFAFFEEHNFEIFYCIGEPLEIRKQGFDAVCEYMQKQLDGINLAYKNLIVAYEPVWAIGTGITPSNDDIAQTHEWLRSKISAPILYGGSVNGANAKEILQIQNVDGVLVGGYSLKASDFANIINLNK